MRIGIDISSATPRRTGIGSYTQELVRNLVLAREHEFLLLFNSLRQPAPRITEFRDANVCVKRTRIPGPFILKAWQYLNFPPVEFFSGKVDLFHSPSTYIPPQRAGLRVTTIHDLDFLRPGSVNNPLGGEYLKWVLQRRLHEMDAVITDSSRTAHQVQEHYGGTICSLDGEVVQSGTGKPRIYPVALGVDERFFERASTEELTAFRRVHSLPETFILHVGRREARKNIPMLIRAYATLCADNPDTPPLVLAGDDAGQNTTELLAKSGVSERVILLGYLGYEQIPTLYQSAALFVLPSIMEGFGLPILEAMASGTPVVCSTTVHCIEYLQEGAALLFDPAAESAIAAAIKRGLEDSALREQMRRLGRESAAELTWKACARNTLRVYELTASAT